MPNKLFGDEEIGHETPIEHELADGPSDPEAPPDPQHGPLTRAGKLVIEEHHPYAVHVAKDRPLQEPVVAVLMDSFDVIGLQTPITVRRGTFQGGPAVYLVAGFHRLTAARRKGYDSIPCFIFQGSETQAEKWQAAEDLHRKPELTKLDRDNLVGKWIRLSKENARETASQRVSAQVGLKLQRNEGRPTGGTNAAARELGLNRASVQRAIKVSTIEPEAQEAAVEAGLADDQAALLRVAAEPTLPLQMEAVEREKTKVPAKTAKEPKPRDGLKALLKDWKLATREERDAFRVEIGAVLPSLEDTNADAQEQED